VTLGTSQDIRHGVKCRAEAMNRFAKHVLMKITFSENPNGEGRSHQARVEQSFSTGDGHGDFCLTAYGATREEAQENLRQLALRMVRGLETVKSS
jgi:hypothetical protein